MSDPFVFVDSRPGQTKDGKRLPRLLCAVDRLNEAARADRIKVFSFSGKRRPAELTPIITYAVTAQKTTNSWDTVAAASFDVSHYVGSYATQVNGGTVSITIKPRWGADMLAYLLRYTAGIYLPPDSAARAAAASDGAEWVLVLLWKSLFLEALRRFNLPREYRRQETNGRFFKGRLDVARHLRENLTDESRFACVHAPLTLDTTIGRTIRCVLRLLARRGYADLVGGLLTHDARLASFGVARADVTPAQIDLIRYTKMTSGYQPLMGASQALLRQLGAGDGRKPSESVSFLVDIAELWENYLQAILNARRPAGYRVFSPNDTGGQWLIEGARREVRPDLIVEKDGLPVAILDAKFKNYTVLGKRESDGVSRGDLHQMATYLYRYGQPDKPIVGLFVTPASGTGEVRRTEHNKLHRMGVLNLGLPGWDHPAEASAQGVSASTFDLPAIQATEARFAKTLWRCLQTDGPLEPI